MVRKTTAAKDGSRARPTWIRQGEVVKKQRRALNVNREEAAIIAERAHEWLDRLERSEDPNDRADFMAWLKESPVHVREVLNATTFDALLPAMLDPDRKINLDELARQTNVVPLGNSVGREAEPAPVKPRKMQDKWIGWSSLIGLSAAAGWPSPSPLVGRAARNRHYSSALPSASSAPSACRMAPSFI